MSLKTLSGKEITSIEEIKNGLINSSRPIEDNYSDEDLSKILNYYNTHDAIFSPYEIFRWGRYEDASEALEMILDMEIIDEEKALTKLSQSHDVITIEETDDDYYHVLVREDQ